MKIPYIPGPISASAKDIFTRHGRDEVRRLQPKLNLLICEHGFIDSDKGIALTDEQVLSMIICAPESSPNSIPSNLLAEFSEVCSLNPNKVRRMSDYEVLYLVEEQLRALCLIVREEIEGQRFETAGRARNTFKSVYNTSQKVGVALKSQEIYQPV